MITNQKVSVIITSYNQKTLLKRAVESVLSQTYKETEIIIADDCSNDGSVAYIKSVQEQNPEKVKCILNENNIGISKNRNRGYKSASGRFITYLDGDDFYYPDKIKTEMERFQADPSLDVVYSNFAFADNHGKQIRLWKNDKINMPEGNLFIRIISRNFPSSTIFRCELMKKEVMEKIGYLDENLFAFEDWDSRIRYSIFAKIGYIDNIGSAYVSNLNGISMSNSSLRIYNEMKKVFDKNRILLNTLDKAKKREITKEMNYKFDSEFIKYKKLPKDLFFILKYLFSNPREFRKILTNR